PAAARGDPHQSRHIRGNAIVGLACASQRVRLAGAAGERVHLAGQELVFRSAGLLHLEELLDRQGRGQACGAVGHAEKSTLMGVPTRLQNGPSMRVDFIGHATLLVRQGGFCLLTDPWWSGPAYRGQWYPFPLPVPERYDLSQVDAVYISHAHE